jgi:hypothetical protein
MNRTLFALVIVALAGAALAGCSRGGDAANAGHAHEAEEPHDAHSAHDVGAIAPPDGTLWPTDEPLRAGMSRIEDAVGRVHALNKPISREQAGELAHTVEENVNYIVRNCKLPPAPDAALHVLIGRMLTAAHQLKSGEGSAEAVVQLDGVLQDYRAAFDHTHAAGGES